MADEGEFQLEPAKELRVGRYVLVDGVPCKVIEIETSSPGKHGSAKMRITAIGIFDGGKKTLLASAHADVQVPVIKKRKGSVVSFSETSVQVMDARRRMRLMIFRFRKSSRESSRPERKWK